MNDCSTRPASFHSHHDSIQDELSANRRSGRPTDDLAGKQVHDDSEVEPPLPRANVGNIRHPDLVRVTDIKVTFYEVGNED